MLGDEIFESGFLPYKQEKQIWFEFLNREGFFLSRSIFFQVFIEEILTYFSDIPVLFLFHFLFNTNSSFFRNPNNEKKYLYLKEDLKTNTTKISD